jgi:hypothetical protein
MEKYVLQAHCKPGAVLALAPWSPQPGIGVDSNQEIGVSWVL